MAVEVDGKSVIKNLAACDKSVRDRSLRTVLQTWLPTQTEVSDDDMKKLWQGIFYCMWHADKVPYQSELIDRLSGAVQSLPLHISVHYFTVFLFTMRREWSRIDRLRLDKFYLLIRRFLHGFFVLLKDNSWDLDFTRRLMGVLFDGTFLADDKFQANGVNYHFASIFVEEVRPFLPLRKKVVELLFGPFVTVLGIVGDKVLVGKIKSNVFDELLKMGKELLDAKMSGIDVDSNDDALALGSIALSMEYSRKFYEMGSSPDCRQGNRKLIFSLHEQFSKLEKDVSSSGVEISIPEASAPDEEVPDLVPMSNEVVMDDCGAELESKELVANGSSKKKGLKKCTKAKKKSAGDSGKKGSDKKSKKEAVVDVPEITNSDGKDETFNETLISNLQMQFEKVAAELGSKDEVASACVETEQMVKSKVSKKRKRKAKGEDRNNLEEINGNGDMETISEAKSGEKSTKRVRFSMKNNLVWKPHSPLPPQSLRLPPAATPRGSALKKGIPPGPIREVPSPSRKAKQKAKAVKKVRKGVKTIKKLKKKKSSSP
ncbi:PREDICTED: ribosomal RNA processing protein 1 homolog isoform X2 [Tarenaya hassleriana]|uniref:ribosomal RNA processing protein 1 homolog isoform X1 n=1 Tax=Tarenaya hassleriana TaxID=28532 RepID=UPI00053C8080|nr:PREDICTED: ribosomal RNA processing protein 1 homolog isoform X1 [Tarenaya hassleriana]XP_010520542.1 PREDICTED: ribosomal RNA processing protein 1 homolog isoform X2 [Tarenaya hassleriana]